MKEKKTTIIMLLMGLLTCLIQIIKVKFLIKYLGVNWTAVYEVIFAFLSSIYINNEKICNSAKDKIIDFVYIFIISLIEIVLIYFKFNSVIILLVLLISMLIYFFIKKKKVLFNTLKDNIYAVKNLIIKIIENNLVILILLAFKENHLVIAYGLYLIICNIVKILEINVTDKKIPSYFNGLLVILLSICYYRFISLLFPSKYDISLLGSVIIMAKLYFDLMINEDYKSNVFIDIILLITNIILSTISLLKFGFIGILSMNLLITLTNYFMASKENKLKLLKEVVLTTFLGVIIIFFSTLLSFENYKMLIISSLILFIICLLITVSLYMFKTKAKLNKFLYYPLKYLGLILLLLVVIFDGISIWKIYKESKEPYVNVLAYHHFVSKEDKENYYKDNAYVLAIEDFEEQLKWLKENDYHPITTSDLYKWLNNEKGLDTKSVLITIDDGNISTYYLALPLIEKYGFHAVSFIITSRVGDKTSEFNPQKMDYIGKDVIEDILLNHPSLELGSHSYNLHGRVNNKSPKDLSKEEISKDVAKSKEILKTDLYCYPFGGRSKNYEEALKDNGYKMSFVFGTSKKTRISNNVYEISRITIDGDMTLEEFANKLK